MAFFNKKVQKWGSWIAGAIAIVFFVALAWNTQFSSPADSTVQSGAEDQKTTQKSTPSTSGSKGTVYTVADSLPDGGVFISLMESTGVSTTLQGTRYTLFLPTNAAMRMVNTSGMTAAEKKRFVQYHIFAGRAVDPDALKSGNIEMLSRDQVNFTAVDGKVRVNNSQILSSHTAANGIVYLIDAALLPPKRPF